MANNTSNFPEREQAAFQKRMEAFTKRAEKAKGDEQLQAALSAEVPLIYKPEPEQAELRAALNAAAVLHWFDAELLKQMLAISTEEASARLDKLKSFKFVEDYRRWESGFYNVQGVTRLGWRRHMNLENPDGFRDLSMRAAACFAEDLTPVGRIEYVYHLLGGDPDRGCHRIGGAPDVGRRNEWYHEFFHATPRMAR
jgi:hypothetical protein